MPITVACSCGKKLSAKDEYAGRTIKCPGCGKALKIPGAGTRPAAVAGATEGARKKSAVPTTKHESFASQLLDEAGLAHHVEGPSCPECHASIPENALLCVSCGYNFKLRRRLHAPGQPASRSSTAAKSPSDTPKKDKATSEVDKALAKAAKELEKEPVEQELGYGTKWGAWLLFLIMMAALAAFIAGGIALVTYIEGQAASQSSDDGY